MTQDDGFNFETSTKGGTFTAPKIKKGYYAGQLLDVRKYEDSNGNLIENKWGPQLILDFGIYHMNDESLADVPMTFKDSTGADRDVILGAFVNFKSRATKRDANGKDVPLIEDGKQVYRSAFTNKSRITNVFKALGWKGPQDGVTFDPRTMIGKWCELNIDDYTPVGKETRSSINIDNVKPFQGAVTTTRFIVKSDVKSSPAQETQKEEEEDEDDEDIALASTSQKAAKFEKLKQELDDGNITQKGYDMAIAQLQGN